MFVLQTLYKENMFTIEIEDGREASGIKKCLKNVEFFLAFVTHGPPLSLLKKIQPIRSSRP